MWSGRHRGRRGAGGGAGNPAGRRSGGGPAARHRWWRAYERRSRQPSVSATGPPEAGQPTVRPGRRGGTRPGRTVPAGGVTDGPRGDARRDARRHAVSSRATPGGAADHRRRRLGPGARCGAVRAVCGRSPTGWCRCTGGRWRSLPRRVPPGTWPRRPAWSPTVGSPAPSHWREAGMAPGAPSARAAMGPAAAGRLVGRGRGLPAPDAAQSRRPRPPPRFRSMRWRPSACFCFHSRRIAARRRASVRAARRAFSRSSFR